jgi:glycosyltransferase involved in cell wall biosynthesis
MSRTARLLIISSGNPCQNPRPLKEARTLRAAGHEVTLLYPSLGPKHDALDETLLAADRFAVEVLHAKRNLSHRAFTWLARRAVPHGFESVRALGSPSSLYSRARAHRADLTIVHNELPHWIGARLLREDRRRVAADFEDWHSEDLRPADRRRRPLRLLREVERALLHDAAYVSTTSYALAEALPARYGGRRPAVITNSFPLQPTPIFYPENAGAVGEPPTFFWFSQTLGPGRGLEEFFAAWRLTRVPSRVVLLGEPAGDFATALLATLTTEQRARVTLLAPVPPDALPELIARHDIGLALEDARILNRDLTITNKILQYLNAGLALVVSATTGQREVLAHAPNAGFVAKLEEPAEFAQQLDAFLADAARLRAARRAARMLAETRYCWEREAPRLLALVENALA